MGSDRAKRHREVRAFINDVNEYLASKKFTDVKDSPVDTLTLDHGVRLRYDGKGIYIVAHPNVPRSDITEGYRGASGEGQLCDAPYYQGHYVIWKDINGTPQVRSGGGPTPPLTDTLRDQLLRRHGFPDVELYRRLQAKYKEEHKEDFERVQKERAEQMHKLWRAMLDS